LYKTVFKQDQDDMDRKNGNGKARLIKGNDKDKGDDKDKGNDKDNGNDKDKNIDVVA
jgi:hypothetical protein